MAEHPKEQRSVLSEKDRERLARLSLMDDDFMSMVFDNNIPAAQLMLRVILNRDDLTVTRVTAQKNLKGPEAELHSARLDILAEDSAGQLYDVEVQRDDSGAIPQRARFYSSMLDSRMLERGAGYDTLRDSYVIFITEHDVLGENEPLYRINRIIETSGRKFGDGSHIVYVNGQIRDPGTALGRLMHDFHCREAESMLYPELKAPVQFFKEDEGGHEDMCDVWKEIRQEAWQEARQETLDQERMKNALILLTDGEPLPLIMKLCGFSVDQLKSLARKNNIDYPF